MAATGDTKLLGIVLELDASGTVKGAQLANEALEGVKQKARGTGATVGGAGQDASKSLQKTALAAAAVGIPMVVAGKKGEEFLKGTIESASNLESGLHQVRMVMGLVGEGAKNKGLQKQFEVVRKEILRIGRDTEFSTSQAAAGFYMLKSAGLETMDAKTIMKYTMALASASDGQIDLAQSAKVTGLIMNKFFMGSKTAIKDTQDAMNGLTKLTFSTDVQFKDMRIMLSALGSTASKMSKTTFYEFMAAAGMMKTMGMSAAQSTQMLNGFSRTIDITLKALAGIGKRSKYKREILGRYGITKEDFVDAEGKYRGLVDMMRRVEGKLGDMNESARGVALRAIFGNDMASNLFNLTKTMRDKTGKTVEQLAKSLQDGGDVVLAGQQAYLKTTKGTIQVWKGTMDLFKSSIGMALVPVLKPFVEWMTKLVNKIVAWGKENPVVFKTLIAVFVVVVGLVKVGGMLLTTYSMVSMIFLATSAAGFKGSLGMLAMGKAAIVAMLPFIKIIAIIALIVAAIYVFVKVARYVAKHWEEIKQAVWNAIKFIWGYMKAYFKYVMFWWITFPVMLIKYIAKHWDKIVDTISSALSEAWEGIKLFFTNIGMAVGNFFVGVWNYIAAIPGKIWGFITGIASAIGSFFANLGTSMWEGFKGALASIWNGITEWFNNLITKFYNAGKEMIMAIWRGIKAVASYPVKAVKWLLTKLRNMLPFSPAKEGPLVTLHEGGKGILKQLMVGVDAESPAFMAAMQGLLARSKGAAVEGAAAGEPVLGGWFRPEPSVPVAAPAGGYGEMGGGININLGEMHFHAVRLSAHEAEVFSSRVMKQMARKLQEWKDRKGGEA